VVYEKMGYFCCKWKDGKSTQPCTLYPRFKLQTHEFSCFDSEVYLISFKEETENRNLRQRREKLKKAGM
jgi:hypothetical protein